MTPIDAAIGKLADLINNGHLLASMNPAGFMDIIADEIIKLRTDLAAANKRVEEMEGELKRLTIPAQTPEGETK
jgi:hypothetical protein